jgi:Calx-beta domain
MLAPAPAKSQTFSGGPVTIVDSPTPPTAAAPFPSQLTVPAAVTVPFPDGTTREQPIGIMYDARLRLNDFTHDFPSDVDALLVGPDGKSSLLLSDAGPSGSATNVDLIFDAHAAGPVPDPLAPGIFLPTDLVEGLADQFPPPAPSGPYGSALSEFTDTDPVGTWSLYLVDDDPDASGSISGWSLRVADRARHEVSLSTAGLVAKEGQVSIAVTVNRLYGGVSGSVGYTAVQSTVEPNPASAGADFEPVSGMLDFAPGEASKTFNVPLVDDRVLERDEHFEVLLTSATGDARFAGQPKATLTIRNDDAPPPPALRARRLQRLLKTGGVRLRAAGLPASVRLRATGTIALPPGAAATVRLRADRAETRPGVRRTPLFLRLPRRAVQKVRQAFTRRPRLTARVVVTATFQGLSSSSKRRISLRP